jgi:hypothetical protein
MQAGIFTYAWDLEAIGYDRVAGELADAGFTAINLATAYHAGKFLMPRNPRHRVYFAEDGALYFQPDLSRYGRIRPRVSAFVSADGDPASRVQRAAAAHGMEYVAWLVCLHNSWLGERHPHATMHTAFGDPLIHSLSPAHPDVREYLVAMIRDLVARYEVGAVELESPGYMGFLHGYHHEISGVEIDPVQQRLLSISFNPVEIAGASKHGIDAERLRAQVANMLDACWNRGIAVMNAGRPVAEVSALLDDPEMEAYLAWQQDQVISLVELVREAIAHSSPATRIRHFASMNAAAPPDDSARTLLQTGDAILAGYAASDDDARAKAEAAKALGKETWGMIRALAPDMTDPASIGPRVEAWRSAGVDGIDVYNYGLMPQPMLDAVTKALDPRTDT